MANETWFYARAGQQLGPVSVEELRHKLLTGAVRADDLVWSEGMSNWEPARSRSELAEVQSIGVMPEVQMPNLSAAPAAPMGARAYAVAGAGAAAPGAASPAMLQYGGYMPPRTGIAEYAGFWLRFAAWFIDWLIVSAAGAGVGFIAGAAIGAALAAGGSGREEIQLAAAAAGQVLQICIWWLYYAFMESSAKQATLGKMALGLIVTDLSGQPISFGKATGRLFGKIISGIILGFGYFMAGWTERRQALHDIMAGTLVIKRA